MPVLEGWFCCVIPGEKNGFLFKLTVYKAEEMNCRVGGDAVETCLGISDTSTPSRGSWLHLSKMVVVLKYLIRFRHL